MVRLGNLMNGKLFARAHMLTSSEGIGPVKLLPFKLKIAFRFEKPPNSVGRVDEKSFPSALKAFNVLRAKSSDGSGPKNPLFGICIPNKFLRRPNSVGRVDDIFVFPSLNTVKASNLPTSDGKAPEKEFLVIKIECSFVSTPISEGIGPEKLLTDIHSSSNSVDRKKSSGGSVPLRLFE